MNPAGATPAVERTSLMPDEERRDDLLLANRAMLVLHGVRTAAHELNNVFQMITGAAELMLANPALPPAMRPRVESLLRQAGRGEGVVRPLADLARADGPDPAALDVTEALSRVIEMRRFEHRRSGISVTVHGGSGVMVRAGARDLAQILLNVLMAAEAAVTGREAAEVVLTVSRDDSEALVAVSGDAAALPEADPHHKRDAAAILVERLGGTLEWRPQAITVRLPAARGRADG